MPVFAAGETPPSWCELAAFDIVGLGAGERRTLRWSAPRARVLVTAGTVQVFGAGSRVLKERQFLDLDGDGSCEVVGISERSGLVLLSGRWGRDLGGCGLFDAENVDTPHDRGDPVAYPKRTAIDAHYHDCDEYWIILSGAGRVVVGGRHHDVKAGDCVAIGMGHHHDLPEAAAPVRAVFFETTLQGEKRVGHLWEHTHGPAYPQPDRT